MLEPRAEETRLALTRRRKLLYGLVVAALFLLGLEVVLRVATRQVGRATIPNETVEGHLIEGAMRYDEDLGWTWATLPLTGLGINEDGFRYSERISRKKPANTFRAFVMGDSQTYGAGVQPDETYPAFAEQELRRLAPEGLTVQVINNGISGYNSLQVLRLIEIELLDWDPDPLVVACRPPDSPSADGLKGARAFNPVDRWLFNYRTYYLIRFVIERSRKERPRAMRGEEMQVSPDELRGRFGNHEIIVDLARRKGVDLVFADYPFWDKNKILPLAPEHELPEGALIAPFTAALIDSGHTGDELFLDNNHMNLLGNRITGETLARTVVDAGLLED